MTKEVVSTRAFFIAKVGIKKSGGQYGYFGHVLNAGQDIPGFALSLPWRANSEDLPIIIQTPDGGTWAGRQFNVSLRGVESALNYLLRQSPRTAMLATPI